MTAVSTFLGRFTWFIALLILTSSATPIAPSPAAAGRAQQRPLSEFLAAQGTLGSAFLPPVPDYLAWTGRPPDYPHLGSMDYAGIANASSRRAALRLLSARRRAAASSGAISKGKYEYELDLHTTNAISFMHVRGLQVVESEEYGHPDGHLTQEEFGLGTAGEALRGRSQ